LAGHPETPWEKTGHFVPLQIRVLIYLPVPKFFFLALAFFVLLLSTVPCCADNDCADGNHAAQTESTSNETCSPFLTCGVCTGFVFAEVGLPLKSNATEKAPRQAGHRVLFVEGWHPRIWQPPKIV